MNVRYTILFICLAFACINVRGANTDTRSDSINIVHTELHIDVSDFASHVLHGEADITFQAIVSGVHYICLDLLGLTVDSVLSGSSRLAYIYNDTLVSVTLPTALADSQQQTVSVYYHGTPLQMPGDFGGFYWDNLYAFNIGVSFLYNPHNFGKVWFPCFDNFVARCSFHFAITTDSTRRALCNGYQDSVITNPTGTRTWYWTMPDNICSYQTTMSVSDYAVLMDTVSAMNGVLPIWLAARGPDTTNLKNSFQHLKNALHIYEGRYGPYQFNKIGYCIVPFTAGAMEHTTSISYMEGIVNGTTYYENYMAHELSHHWFGDLVTCDNEGEMWLNEGWAKYNEDLFYEGMYGEAQYRSETRTKHEDVIRLAHIVDSAYWPMPNIPPSLTYSFHTVYEKGADRVHTLRGYMGDSLFFGCLQGYLQTYRLSGVNSYKLRDYLVSCSGLSNVNDFFDDWIFDGGFPDFSIDSTKVTNTGGAYNVGIAIRQRGDHTSHYFTNVPLEVAYFDSSGNKTVMTAMVSGACTQYFATLPFYPAYIALDFDEKMSDAVTDYWTRMAGTSGINDFGVAKMTVTLHQSTDSSLVRVEHHFVAPDATKNPIPGLHLSDYRYWNVDGIWSPDFAASASINYNGSTDETAGYLDNTFITNSEDSLVVMYRPDAQSAWQIDADVFQYPGSSLTDKVGSFTINTLQKGQYALAIWQANKIDSPQALMSSPCSPLSVADIDAFSAFRAYPNPVNSEELNVETSGANSYTKCVLINMTGETVMEKPLKAGQNKFTVPMKGLVQGTYLISLIDKDNKRISKKIQKLN